MIKLVVSTFVEKGSLELSLNGEVILNDTDRITRELEPDGSFILSWHVHGEVGSSYTISVSSPREAEFHWVRSIGKTGEDFNDFKFRI